MSEYRQNPITKNWVLIAPNRSKRPEDFRTYSVMHGEHEFDASCVFCPGEKEKENKELSRFPESGDWQVRVIENKYQALEQTKLYAHHNFYSMRAGYGDHEVLITRKHNEPVALQSVATIELSLSVVVARMKELRKDERIAYVQFFHNHGKDAGASLVHPHHQLLATHFLPPHIHNEMLGCYHYNQVHGVCAYCDIIQEERKLDDRVVFETEHFIVISAYASRNPFETWILPKKHSASFDDIDAAALKHLAYVLKLCLGQLYTKLSDPPLNFYIHSLPFKKDARMGGEEASYHWHLTVFPRLTNWAGFEFATGIPINPMPPELTAEFLKTGMVR
jgi:UDPglucose--hexose-1-phosphate uridylyltransferase